MRNSGILMPITSLPSPWGVGTMGEEARRFLSFLRAAGQSCWQILPINPTSHGDSPYQSFSSFAGNPYLIDLDDLARDGLLSREAYADLSWGAAPDQVDYSLLYRQRFPILRQAVAQLQKQEPQALAEFCIAERRWLPDYALFMALKNHYDGAPWWTWSEGLRRRDPQALREAQASLAEDVAFYQGVQYLFFRQWSALKACAVREGISIIGDLPIYVALDSADVWSDPGQFQLDENLQPTEVAGCPPDGFSADGQLWGNPLFDWEKMARDGYRWWMDRIAAQFRVYDILRIDHFRGFESYYAIPFGDKDARRGRWRKGPGLAFFRQLEQTLGQRQIIAEDLGFLTPAVRQMLRDTGYPGMKVLEFAFDSRDDNGREYLPHNFCVNCVAYVGTHDNDTALGWCTSAPAADVALAKEYLGIEEDAEMPGAMLRTLYASVAERTVAQMQDLLALGSEARMNTPSTVGHNWRWRALPGFDSPALAARLRRQMELYDRLPAAAGAEQ